MKNIPIFLLLVTGWILLFYSCKKEYSCENCMPENQPPVALAGPDQRIRLPLDSAVLDGSASSDPDGIIRTWQWSKISGPAALDMVRPADSITPVRQLTTGTYSFALTVTDDHGASAADTINIIVDDATDLKHPPIAHAGNDTTIFLPQNTITLNAGFSTDPDNDITGYQWTKISGPSSFHLTNANQVQTQAMNLVQGVYLVELVVTDDSGLSDRDTVQVTVKQNTSCTNCRMVFVSNRDGNNEIYTCDMNGSNIIRLTYDPGNDDYPAWSPNGSKIAFISNRTGQTELYIMHADGTNIVRKTFSGNYTLSPAWSPDGTRIAYSAEGIGASNIWVVGTDANSGPPQRLSVGMGYDIQPAWSPDGTKIAYATDWAAYDFVYDIMTMHPDGINPTLITEAFNEQRYYLQPRWSPDGAKLSIAVSDVNQRETAIYTINADGSNITKIIAGAAPASKTSWWWADKKIIYTSLSGTRKDVTWVSIDGSATGTIITNAWNADGRF